ncbi:MAG: WD40/YVTN/BNR-like repeat-containing protein [Candidatus Limnocylindrales bacterium]
MEIPTPAGFDAVTSSDVTSPPVITGPGSAVALVGLTSATQNATVALVTSDAGRTWTISASLPADESAMPFEVFSTGAWVAVFAPDGTSTSSLLESDNGGRTWSPIGAVGIPTNGAIRSFRWLDPRHAWALVDAMSDATPPEQMPGQLYATSDGGATWSDITPAQ